MSIQFDFTKSLPKKADTLVLTIFEDLERGPDSKKLDETMNALINDVLERQSGFKGKHGQTLVIRTPKDVPYHQIILLGLGDLDDAQPYLDTEEAGAKLLSALKSVSARNVAVDVDISGHKGNKLDEDSVTANLISGIKLASYEFHTYKTKKHDPEKDEDYDLNVKKITFKVNNPDEVKETAETLAAEVEGVFTSRDLANEPANTLTPDRFANYIQQELDPLGVKVTVLNEKDLKKMGAGAFLAVGQGSDNPPRMVIMEYQGAEKKSDDFPLALIGKGITFDTGGISLKPAGGMQDMKMDMCGAASVVGTIKSLALRKAKTNVVAAVALAENMPSHNAYRPGDIIKSLSGKTIEVLNTDAEGRMVLVDTLTHIQNEYKPKTVINLATLTGAMMVALGSVYAGAFVNDDDLWGDLEKASTHSGEKLWRMPLDKEFRKAMESEIADLKNLGGRYAGACTAAGFLEAFIDEDVKWTHVDIAGVAWGKQAKSIYPKGPTGYGVRLLNRYVEAAWENR